MDRRRVGSWCAVVLLAAGAASACGGSRDSVAPAGSVPSGAAPAADANEGAKAQLPRGGGPVRPPGHPTGPQPLHSGVPLSPQEAASVRPEEPSFVPGEVPPTAPPAGAPTPDASPTPPPPPPSPTAPAPTTPAPPTGHPSPEPTGADPKPSGPTG